MSEQGGPSRFGRLGASTLILAGLSVLGILAVNVFRVFDSAGGGLDAWRTIFVDTTVGAAVLVGFFLALAAWRHVSVRGLSELSKSSPSSLVYSTGRTPALTAALSALPRSDFDQLRAIPLWLGFVVSDSRLDIVDSRYGTSLVSFPVERVRAIAATTVIELGRQSRSVEVAVEYHERIYRVPITVNGYGLLGLFTPTAERLSQIVDAVNRRINLPTA